MTNSQIAFIVVGSFMALMAMKVFKPFVQTKRRTPLMRRFATQYGYHFIGMASKDEENELCEYRVGPLFPENHVAIKNYMRKCGRDGMYIIFDIIYAQPNMRSVPGGPSITMEPPTTIFVFVSNNVKFNAGILNERIPPTKYEDTLKEQLWIEARGEKLMVATLGQFSPITSMKKLQDIQERIITELGAV